MAFSAFAGLTLLSVSTFAADVEPANSLFASGKWVKIRVDADGVYQLTDAELLALGFDDPSRVRVYGYSPTLLLTHNSNLIPADVIQVPTVRSNGKVAFYAKSNTELEPEIWRYEKFKATPNQIADEYAKPSTVEHLRHVFSTGAAYFLSDVDNGTTTLTPIPAPVDDGSAAATTHVSIIHNEKDINHYGVGGAMFLGDALPSANASLSYPFTLSKVARTDARLIYQGMDTKGGRNAPMQASFSSGINVVQDVGETMSVVTSESTHQLFGLYRRFQSLQIPVQSAPAVHTVNFKLNPAFTGFNRAALDYWILLYTRTNDLSEESQRLMCFDVNNCVNGNRFSVSNATGGSEWHFWDVTSTTAVKECQMVETGDGTLIGEFDSYPSSLAASYVVAFDMKRDLLHPEIVGEVPNQNLHSMSTPDVVILTSALLTDVSEEVADVHRRLQGLDVRVIDQEQIFNEFGSGNVSPESVRRFLAYLDGKTPGKLKSLIIVGPPVVNNAKEIHPGNPCVVTAQNECNEDATFEVRSLYSDSFFGRFGNPLTAGNWSTRHLFYQTHGNEMGISVGRIPLSNASEIRAYMQKVEEYISNPPVVPSLGTIVGASDYEGNSSAAMHYVDVEKSLRILSDRFDNELTIVRPASNFFNKTNNAMCRNVMLSSLQNGVDLFVYFGHGRPDAIGSVGNDNLLGMLESESYSSPGRYPFALIGSCNIARCDVNPSNISTSWIKNPHGGMIGIVAATREVFQQENTVFGVQFAKEYDSAVNGDYWGDVFARAQSKAVTAAATNRRTLINHLCYTYIGDPLVPIYKTTGSVAITNVNDGSEKLYCGAANTVSGEILNSDGTVNPSFDGTVILNVFDVPRVRKNLVVQGSTPASDYIAEINEDCTVLKQIAAPVRSGKFSVEFNAPMPSASGTQRIQAYAYSDDSRSRALGAVKNLTSVVDNAREPVPSRGDISIRSFAAADADFDLTVGGGTTIEAEIYAPNGLSGRGFFLSPIRFVIDGVSHPEVARMLTYIGNDTYRLVYETGDMSAGRHVVELAVFDEAGGEDYSEIEFSIHNAPVIEITAGYRGNGTIEVDCTNSLGSETRVIVESLNGSLVKDVRTQTMPVMVTELPAGVYRVYTQHKADNFHSSSPKAIVIVD